MYKLRVILLTVIFCTSDVYSNPENAETNDPVSNATQTFTTNNVETRDIAKNLKENVIRTGSPPIIANTNATQCNIFSRLYLYVITPFKIFFKAKKVNQVMRNIGTCAVNGFMEIISYYLPAPLIPLIAATAGTLISFEPVVMLREKMPATSYRRAFKKAVNAFMGTFDKYKIEDNYDDDPYMTMRFNRRVMNLDKNEAKKSQRKYSEDIDD